MIKPVGKSDNKVLIDIGDDLLVAVELTSGDVSPPINKYSYIAHNPYWTKVSKKEAELAINLYDLYKKMEGHL